MARETGSIRLQEDNMELLNFEGKVTNHKNRRSNGDRIKDLFLSTVHQSQTIPMLAVVQHDQNFRVHHRFNPTGDDDSSKYQIERNL